MAWSEWVRTVEIEPSLYAADFAILGEQVDHLLSAGVRIFHFDVGDGHFVEPITMGPIVLEKIAPIVHERGGFLDCHLMVSNPERHIPQIARAGGDSVTVHVEAMQSPAALAALAREYDIGAGLAVNPDTPVELALAAAEGFDLVTCMGVHPGYSGQDFIPETIGRIRALRESLPANVFVQVDGGIDRENIRQARDAGAALLVAASAIFAREDLTRAYRRLVQALA